MAEEQATEVKKAARKQLAVLLIRGREIGLRHDVRRALDRLRLLRKQVCAVVEDNPMNRGLLNKVKDFVAYGPVSDAIVKDLQKRGSLKEKDGKELNVFRMPPPRGGYGRRGIKVSYNNGGVLGLRPSMDDLLKRML